jgi:hypothetical protein
MLGCFIAVVLFPLWWIVAFWRVPKTRVIGGTVTEKEVPLDGPQIEFGVFLRCLCMLTDARS